MSDVVFFPCFFWWKAQLLRRWDAQRTVAAPLEWGERVQVAIAMTVLILTAALAAGWWRQSLTG